MDIFLVFIQILCTSFLHIRNVKEENVHRSNETYLSIKLSAMLVFSCLHRDNNYIVEVLERHAKSTKNRN